MKNIEVVTKITKIENDLDELQLTASNVTISFDNSDNGMSATNVQEAIEENKTSILSLEKLVGQVNKTLIEECNKFLDI